MLDRHLVEKMGREDFSRAAFLDARRRAWDLLQDIAAQIRPGMTEPDAQALLKLAMARHGSEKPWHRPIIRFGSDTQKIFTPQSDPTLRLAEDDIFFLDFGPVWQGYEADVGATFTLGTDQEMAKCAGDAQRLFELVRDEWLRTQISGTALYDFAETAAQSRGWRLVRQQHGHRLGDFPHHAHFRGGLSEVDFYPASDAWVLEIHIRHPTRPFGAFYEDLLVAGYTIPRPGAASTNCRV
jgi:Xaa-Pro aminopeptidase